MRILTTLTYYSPHISGLTVYARRLIRELVASGHEVTVLTSHYESDLPAREIIDGAAIIRSPVALRVSKGVLMPLLPAQIIRLAAAHDLIHVHLPQFEGSQAALTGRALGKPVVATYHCDIQMPPGVAQLAFTPAIRLSHYLTGRAATRIVVNSAEYAMVARLPSRFGRKVVPIYPPVELSRPDAGAFMEVAQKIGTARPVIGFVGRFAEEKGIEFLIEAMPLVLQRYPLATLALVGEWQHVPGEDVYARLKPRIDALGEAVVHLGVLSDPELRAVYEKLDVLVLPSINSTESFGMTQAEAMLAGTPVVSSNLPGVRVPVARTGMGVLVEPRNPQAIADGICEVLSNAGRYRGGAASARALFGTAQTAAAYQNLFDGLLSDAPLSGALPTNDPAPPDASL